jgi:cytochrome P450
MPSEVRFNPYNADFRRNPYEVYRRLREEDPVHRSAVGAWVLTRYEDIAEALKNKKLSTEIPTHELLAKTGGDNALFRLHRNAMLLRDPPAHTRLRALVAKAFAARSIDRLRGRIATIVADVLDAVPDPEEVEVVRDCAFLVPVMAISEMLGVPHEDGRRLHAWTRELAGSMDLASATSTRIRSWNQTIEAFQTYLRSLIEQRRQAPEGDLLSALVMAEEQDERLSIDEVIATCLFLFATSHETTTLLIANAVLCLLRAPDQLALVRARPEAIPAAVEETLRCESPLQLSSRRASEDLEIGGRRIAAGERVLLSFGASGRDPAQFADPDRFDVERADASHLAFGHGVHYCLGAALARVETAAFLEGLLNRYPRLTLKTEEPRWAPSVSLRALEELWIGS